MLSIIYSFFSFISLKSRVPSYISDRRIKQAHVYNGKADDVLVEYVRERLHTEEE